MKKLLIISDNKGNIALFSKHFSSEYTVITVPSPENALSIISNIYFDIIISDIPCDLSPFADSTLITVFPADNAFYLPNLSDEMISALYSWIKLSQSKAEFLLSENTKLQKKIDDIAIINRAKLVLMKTLGLNENEAHKYIEKKSMETRVSKVEIAKSLLKVYE